MKRLLAGFLAVLMILPCLTVSASAKYQYIDYTRIYGGSTSKSYAVDAYFGPLSLLGRLRYTGEFTDEEIDEEIRDTLRWMQITEEDIGKAHAAVAVWEAQEGFTEQDAKNIINNWAKMFGLEEPVTLAQSFYDFLRADDQGWKELGQLGVDLTDQGTNILKGKVEAWAFHILRVKFEEFAEEGTLYGLMDKVMYEQFNLKYRQFEFGGRTISGKTVIDMLKNTLVVSAEQYMKDKQRWADRVDAVNANALLKTFYDTVNNYLLARDPMNGNWVLSVAGGGLRYFNFFGSTGNKQYYTLAISAAKDSSASTVYAYRGQGANLPFGTYVGSGAIRLTHDMTPFDVNFWNLPIGALPRKNWLSDMISATFGGGVVEMRGGTTIKREFTADKIVFSIPGGYAYQYSSYIPATPGNRDVTTSISLSQFNDELYTHSDHFLSYKWGLVNLQDDKATALEYVILSMHSEMDGSNLQVICDNCEAYVNIIGIELADIKDGDIISANGWDSNIWAGMDGGIKLVVHMC